MAFALNDAFNGCLNTLISADMAPSIGKISPEYVPASSPLSALLGRSLKIGFYQIHVVYQSDAGNRDCRRQDKVGRRQAFTVV